MTSSYRLIRAIRAIRVGVVLLVIVLGIAGCSKLKSEHSTTGGGGNVADNSNTSTPVQPSSAAEAKPTTWQANGTSLNATDLQTLTLACSPGGSAHSVWGSDIYTSDSSICTAAVHSGLISYQNGGAVTVEIRPGRPIYGCSERNGVTTSCYGQYRQSFVFKTPNTEALVREADDETLVTWNTSASIVGFETGKTVKFKCPAGGQDASVWGSDIYTVDSSICTAAAHTGKFTKESGGSVTIELRPGESSYHGTTRNGVKTNDYGKYGTSFVVK